MVLGNFGQKQGEENLANKKTLVKKFGQEYFFEFIFFKKVLSNKYSVKKNLAQTNVGLKKCWQKKERIHLFLVTFDKDFGFPLPEA